MNLKEDSLIKNFTRNLMRQSETIFTIQGVGERSRWLLLIDPHLGFLEVK